MEQRGLARRCFQSNYRPQSHVDVFALGASTYELATAAPLAAAGAAWQTLRADAAPPLPLLLRKRKPRKKLQRLPPLLLLLRKRKLMKKLQLQLQLLPLQRSRLRRRLQPQLLPLRRQRLWMKGQIVQSS